MMMRCLVKPKRLFNSMPSAGPRDIANQALRYGTLVIDKIDIVLSPTIREGV